ncbi:TetR/AcrR family transcriptional regulator [Saccharopolyspora griseoalba]|uniref:TetR/AcrR family transcriptional regulator n=1 Tax=Saccharopolyspora griseoalba TaxID=1431848 RepID=A0ABW2LDX5_9PSEU
MGRYGKEHKEATRRRIIETSGRRLKQDGIDGSGVAALMKDAGLTNGAFYGHFASKDDLVATVVAEQLTGQRADLDERAPDRAGIEQFIRDYLAPRHRDAPERGCPSAALLDEIGRCGDTVKQAYTDGLMRIVDDIAARIAPDDPGSARVKTLTIFAALVGTLQLARAVADQQLSDALLEQGIRDALALLDSAAPN